jgi:hypothetical protein
VDFLSAPSNFLVQWFRNFESKALGPRFPSLEFSRMGDALLPTSELSIETLGEAYVASIGGP